MKQTNHLLGIDIGTFESKGVIIDPEGSVLVHASVKHGMENPKPGYYEHDANNVWWHDFCILSKRLLEQSQLPANQIAAVGVSTLGTDCLPVDRQGNPLRKAILYGIDSRAQQEIAFLTDYYGEEQVQQLFGRPLCSGDVCAKILWIRNHEPDVFEKTYKFLTGSSFLVARLTGEFVIDRFLGIASLRPLYCPDGSIRAEMCAPFCSPDQLPIGKSAAEIAGFVTEWAAAQTGLLAGTPVTVGTGDSAAEAISCGVLKAGDTMIQLGSSTFFYACTDHLIQDHRVRGNSFVIPGTYSVAAGTNNCGTVTSWFRDQLFPQAVQKEAQGGPNAFETMMDGIAELPPGSDGLVTLPYFAGERTPINDPNAKGVLFGLSLSHTKQHLYRSALEGIAFTIAQHIDIFRENHMSLDRVTAVGGGTKNDIWMQIIADICGIPIHLPKVTIGAAYGDALMAGIGIGTFDGFSALGPIIQPAKTYVPDLERHLAYAPYRSIFDELYTRNCDLMHVLIP